MKMLKQFKSFVLFLVSVIFLLAPFLREMVLKALAIAGVGVGDGGVGRVGRCSEGGGGDNDHYFPITLGLDNSHFIFWEAKFSNSFT